MASKRPKILWGSHTKAYRNRVAERYAKDYGLSRRSVREMFNRGTLKPSARTPEDRVPRKFQHSATFKEGDRDRLSRKLVKSHTNTLWPMSKERADNIVGHLEDKDVTRILRMSQSEMSEAASFQTKEDSPKWLQGLWYRRDDQWHNPFWYKDK